MPIYRGIKLVAAVVVFTASLLRGNELPDDFQNYMLSHHYGVVKTESEGWVNNQTFVAELNGKKVRFVIDTGASRTCILASCARHLQLVVQDSGHEGGGVGGKVVEHTGLANLASFKINHCEINRINPIMVLSTHAVLTTGDGLFGLDSLRLNAAILPVGGHGFIFKPGPLPPVSITGYMQKKGFTPIPLRVSEDLLLLDGKMNGQPFVGMIDCGASHSSFEVDYVKKTGVENLKRLGAYMQGVDGKRNDTYLFTPKQLAFGSYTVPPTTLMAVESPMLKNEKVDVLIGYDLLAIHGAVIDTGAGVLWMR